MSLKTGAFASIRVVVPRYTYSTSGTGEGQAAKPTGADLVLVGMAQNVRISDSFGTRPQNVLGNPLPIITPGYMTTNISIEKCTVDGQSFRSMGAFNPLWAHVGATYKNPIQIGSLEENVPIDGLDSNGEMYPFMFILAIKDKVSNSYEYGDLPFAGAERDDPIKAPNMFGTYACVLSDANISLTSQNSVIMDSVTAVARPITGSWLSNAVRSALHSQGADGPGTNGMNDLVNSPMYGYRSGQRGIKPKAGNEAKKKADEKRGEQLINKKNP